MIQQYEISMISERMPMQASPAQVKMAEKLESKINEKAANICCGNEVPSAGKKELSVFPFTGAKEKYRVGTFVVEDVSVDASTLQTSDDCNRSKNSGARYNVIETAESFEHR